MQQSRPGIAHAAPVNHANVEVLLKPLLEQLRGRTSAPPLLDRWVLHFFWGGG